MNKFIRIHYKMDDGTENEAFVNINNIEYIFTDVDGVFYIMFTSGTHCVISETMYKTLIAILA